MAAVDNEAVVSVVLDESILNELVHQVGSNLASFVVLLELGELLLQLQDLQLLVLRCEFLLECRFLVGLDLGLGPPTLAADLQHVRGDALSN